MRIVTGKPRGLCLRNLVTISEKQRMYLSWPDSLAEGARFQTPTALETIDLDLLLSFRCQSLTEESEAGEEPINTDGTR